MIHPTTQIHSHALIEPNVTIGANTRVWAFSHILSNVIIGDDCNICDHTFIENNVTLGNRITVKAGVYLWTGLEIEDDVFIGPGATFTNDKHPRSKKYPLTYPKTRLERGCSIGANATVLPDIVIGSYAMIGAGSVVTKNVPAFAIVYGNPAQVQGWVCRCGTRFNTNTLKQKLIYKCSCNTVLQFTPDLTEVILL